MIGGTTFFFHKTQSFYINFAAGEKYFKQNKYTMSLAHLIPAAQAQPQNPQVLEYLTLVYDKLGKKGKAFESLQRLANLENKNLTTQKWLADIYYSNSDFAAAEKKYRDILKLEDKPEVRRKLAEVLVWQKKYSQAEILLTQLSKGRSKNYKDLELLADISAWNKEYNKAIELYKQVMASDKKNQDVVLKLADTLRYAGRDKEAIMLYRQYINSAK